MLREEQVHNYQYTRPKAVARKWSVIKLFLKILQNSQENTCARVFFKIKLQASGLLNKN